jgi:predicted nucleic-acid-binding Zn-ribbon protein
MPLKKEEIPNLSYAELMEHVRLSPIKSDEYVGLLDSLKEEVEKRNPTKNYKCFKCGHEHHYLQQFRASSGFFSSFFGVQTVKYIGVVCKRCAYTEFYHGEVSPGEQAIDFVFGS